MSTLKLYTFVFALLFTLFVGCSLPRRVTNEVQPRMVELVRNKQYVISETINLNGRHIIIPEGDTLFFKGGKFVNGILEGNNTVIINKKKKAFENVTIKGTWKNKVVFSEWLDFKEGSREDNRENFTNLMALCKGDEFTKVYLKRGNYWTTTVKDGSAISIPSNTHFIFTGKIYELPNSFERTSLIRLYKVDNVIIEGGTYIGDVVNHHGNKGEWSHGISIWGSTNVLVKKVECREFWGDGIDLIEAFDLIDNKIVPVYNCNNVIIDSSKCLYNRRQGLSIESGHNCIIRNSIFSYTGQIGYTPPAAGIDIEAWATNNEKLKNIRIEKCKMKNNRGHSLQSFCNAIYGDDAPQYINEIKIIDCKMEDVLIAWTNKIEFEDCLFEFTPVENKSIGIKYSNCVFKNRGAR